MENWEIVSSDPSCHARTYLEQSAELRRQIVSLRESRALLDRKQRMREDRATRMSLQFKTILSQMKQAQEEAFVVQERNMKFLGLFSQISRSQSGEQCSGENENGPNFQHAKHQLAIIQEETRETGQTPSTIESNCAESSSTISSSTRSTKSPHTDSRVDENSSDSQSNPPLSPHSDEEQKKQRETPLSFRKVFLRDDREYLIAGEQRPTEKLVDSDAGAKTHHLMIKENSACARIMVGVFSPEKNSSLSDAAMRELGSSDLNNHTGKFDKDQGLQALCGNDVNIDGHDGGMKSSPLLSDRSSSAISSTKEDNSDRTGFQTLIVLEQKNALVKIEKNDFFPDIGEHVVYKQDEEASEMSNTDVLSSNQVAQGKPDHTEAISSVRSDSLEQAEGKMDNFRNLVSSWSLDDKVSVLTTLKNTMFLWEDRFSQFGWWPDSDILLSAVIAAKVNQEKLFEYLEVQEDISRPLTCCGAVYELVKAYPPEKLLPLKFITDHFASDDWNNQFQDGLTFEQLEIAQQEHSNFWQMLVHHSICVKDLGLGTLKEVASALREIFCPRELLGDLSPEIGSKVHENMLEFLNRVFKGREIDQTQNILEETDGNSVPLSYNFRIPVEKGSPCDLKRPRVYTVEAAQTSVRDVLVSDGLELSLLHYDFLDIATGYKSESSARSRGSKRGLFSSLGSLVQTPFKMWRSRGMSKGAESIEEGFVRLLSPKRSVLRIR